MNCMNKVFCLGKEKTACVISFEPKLELVLLQTGKNLLEEQTIQFSRTSMQQVLFSYEQECMEGQREEESQRQNGNLLLEGLWSSKQFAKRL